ncbi:MAG: hypothetical protein QME51_10705 [Planctomycetota bacterium]|nr:hypothetical protein [Planctomycetota bacterium]
MLTKNLPAIGGSAFGGKLTNMALETEIIQINQAKLAPPRRNRSKGVCWSERRGALRHQFCGRERELWDPKFYQEWLEYVEAVENGELRG